MPRPMPSAYQGRVKACEACRQFKLRCDSHEHDYGMCSRCRKVGRDCIIPASPKRRNQQTKADLQLELDTLRSKYEAVARNGPPASLVSAEHGNIVSHERQDLDNGFVRANTANTDQMSIDEYYSSQLPPSFDRGFNPQDSTRTQGANQRTLPQNRSMQSHMMDNHSGQEPSPISTDIMSLQPSLAESFSTSTISRQIGELELNAGKIDACFAAFHEHYAHVIPRIFDEDKSPNDVHDTSTILFYTIICVGARRFSRDPTIVESLAKPVMAMIKTHLLSPDNAIHTIKAALLLCTWPLPLDTTYADPSHAISGAMLQLAIQQGLHLSSRKQDFIRFALKQPIVDQKFRARLWAYCVMIFQGVSVYDGFPPLLTVDSAPAGLQRSLFEDLPSIIEYQHRLHQVLIDAVASMSRLVEHNHAEHLMTSAISAFEAQIQQIASMGQVDRGLFTLESTRLYIRAFHFFMKPSTDRDSGLLHTYFIACSLLETASRLDKDENFGTYCTIVESRAIAFAAHCILRVRKSNLNAQIDLELGERMFFEAIRMHKKRSIQNNDLDARSALILTQLWSSTQAFRFKDGSINGLRLLLRGRLAMSVLFDSFWWWRAEFGGKSNPYVDSYRSPVSSPTLRAADSSPTTQEHDHPTALSDVPHADQFLLLNNLLDASHIPDWRWEEFGDQDLNWC